MPPGQPIGRVTALIVLADQRLLAILGFSIQEQANPYNYREEYAPSAFDIKAQRSLFSLA